MWTVINKDYNWAIFDNDRFIVGCSRFIEEAKILCEIHNRSVNDKV